MVLGPCSDPRSVKGFLKGLWEGGGGPWNLRTERKFSIGNLLLLIHFIIEMICWTGLAPGDFEIPVPGSLISVYLPSHPYT